MNRAKAEIVLEALKKFFSEKYGENPDFFMADHTHEELTPGSWSIAYEGWWSETPWTLLVTEPDALKMLDVEGVFLEALNSWCLGLYDA